MSAARSPRVKANDWSVLGSTPLHRWDPKLAVSIVIPAFRAERTLPYTLAALAAQSYPGHLLEVVVADDGHEPPLELPEIRPENTRVVRTTASWGRARACHEGARAADGDVIHWLDADMVPCRHEVEAQMRWHHLLDHAVVLGHKAFVDADDLPTVSAVHDAVDNDKVADLFAERWSEEHAWVEKIWQRTGQLRRAGFRAFHVHVGATASVNRDLYEDAGAMDPGLKLGEDIELGYRLAMKGAVFVPDRDATSWHLGRSTLMQKELEVQRFNAPFIAERVPDFRKFREARGRMYKVPFVEVVVAAEGHSFEEVKYTLDGVLQAVPGDVRCVLLGPWSQLRDERRSPLEDPLLDLRLVREEYGSEGRVEFREELAPTAFPALFRLHLPSGWRPGETTLDDLAKDMQLRALGLRSSLLPDGRVVRLERTAAFERANRVLEEGEDVDDVVDAVSATWWSEGVEDGFLHPEHAPEPTADVANRRQGDPRKAPARGEAPPPAPGTARRVASALRRRIRR